MKLIDSLFKCRWICWSLFLAGGFFSAADTRADELSKGHRILIDRGLQIQGMVSPQYSFDIDNYKAANYTGVNWFWYADYSQLGSDQSFPWSRWVSEEQYMPFTPEEIPHAESLVALQFSDELYLNAPEMRDRAVKWFNDYRDQFPNTILYMNNSRNQVYDETLTDYIHRARPDMLFFDDYPFRADIETGRPIGGSPIDWYSELRRYRVHAVSNNIPFGNYRQTFEQRQEDSRRDFRRLSASEMNLNTFASLAFGATYLVDFMYNMPESTLLTLDNPEGTPTRLHAYQGEINRRARLFGQALTRLTPLNDQPVLRQATTDMLYLRGQNGSSGQLNPLPRGFSPDDLLPNAMSEWEPGRNDPFMAGFSVENLGSTNEGLPGDVILSWFKPLESSADDPNDPLDQLYFFVVNGLTSPDGTAEDCRQRITIDFDSSIGDRLLYLNTETGGPGKIALPLASETDALRQLVFDLDGGDGMLFKFDGAGGFLGFLSGDANLNGIVDRSDLDALASNFGTTLEATWSEGDFDLDGDVDVSDINIIAHEYDDGHSAAMLHLKGLGVVPEPAGLGLAFLAMLFAANRREGHSFKQG